MWMNTNLLKGAAWVLAKFMSLPNAGNSIRVNGFQLKIDTRDLQDFSLPPTTGGNYKKCDIDRLGADSPALNGSAR